MSQLSIRALVLVGMMLLASASPLAQFTKADPEIELQVDMSHMILTIGESMNLTLTIENNGSSIETYDVETSTNGLSSLWTATPTASSVSMSYLHTTHPQPSWFNSPRRPSAITEVHHFCERERRHYLHLNRCLC